MRAMPSLCLIRMALLLLLASLSCVVLPEHCWAFVGLGGNNSLVIRPPLDGPVFVGGTLMVGDVDILDVLNRLQKRVAQLESDLAEAVSAKAKESVWVLTASMALSGTQTCANFKAGRNTTVFIEVAGGGGGGGSQGSSFGAAGQESSVTLGANRLMTAAGGAGGNPASGTAFLKGVRHGNGTSNVPNAHALFGGGADGGGPGRYFYNGPCCGACCPGSSSFTYTGTQGGSGGFVAGHVELSATDDLRVCAGAGGEGGDPAAQTGGSAGGTGFVRIRGLF